MDGEDAGYYDVHCAEGGIAGETEGLMVSDKKVVLVLGSFRKGLIGRSLVIIQMYTDTLLWEKGRRGEGDTY